MSEELRECPFCRRKAEHYCYNYSKYRRHTIRCRYCFADCGEHDTPEMAASVWNARPTEDTLKAEVESLKSKLTLVKKHIVDNRDALLSVLKTKHDSATYREFALCQSLIELLNTDQNRVEYES